MKLFASLRDVSTGRSREAEHLTAAFADVSEAIQFSIQFSFRPCEWNSTLEMTAGRVGRVPSGTGNQISVSTMSISSDPV